MPRDLVEMLRPLAAEVAADLAKPTHWRESRGKRIGDDERDELARKLVVLFRENLAAGRDDVPVVAWTGDALLVAVKGKQPHDVLLVDAIVRRTGEHFDPTYEGPKAASQSNEMRAPQ
jgi:hypothetical protein